MVLSAPASPTCLAVGFSWTLTSTAIVPQPVYSSGSSFGSATWPRRSTSIAAIILPSPVSSSRLRWRPSQSSVGDLDGATEVLAEGASVAGDRSVDATVSAASAVREAETRLDEAIRAYRRAAAAWRALLAQW